MYNEVCVRMAKAFICIVQVRTERVLFSLLTLRHTHRCMIDKIPGISSGTQHLVKMPSLLLPVLTTIGGLHSCVTGM